MSDYTAADGRREKRIIILSKLGARLGLLTLFAGVMVLVGWEFDIPVLKSILPGYVTMKANTAIGFIFAGLSLLLLRSKSNLLLQRLSVVCAAMTTLIGLLTLIQYFFGVNLGIDQLFFQESAGTLGTFSPGRIDPATAVNFFLLGSALLLMNFRRAFFIAQHLLILTGLIGLFQLLGYFYGVTAFISFSHFTQMAFYTAVLFIFMSFGALFIYPAEGIMERVNGETLGGWLLRRLMPFAITTPIVLGWLRITGERNGYFNSETGVALMMVTIIILLSTIIRWAAGKLTRIDTIRQNAESKVRESENQIRATLYGIGDGVIATDKNGCITRMNPMAEQLTGWKESEASGMPLHEIFKIINENTRAKVESPVEHVLRDGKIIGLANHTLLISRDGTEHPIADSGAQIVSETGGIIGVVLVFRDQTADRAAHNLIRESEVHYRTLADSGQALIWTSGVDMKCDYLNQPWLEFTGRTLEQEVGNGYMQDVHPDDLKRSLNTYKSAFQNRDRFSMDYRLRYNDGSYRWIQNSGTPRYDSNGSFIGYIGHCLDITELKNFEEEIKRNNVMQNAMNDLLRLSLENLTITEFLSRSLDIILSLNWLELNPKGAIFLADETSKILNLAASKNLSPEIIAMCTRIPYGYCLCGKAALTKETQFADHINDQHEACYEGMAPHGHYCLPILSGDRLLGVLNLYVIEGHKRNEWEENFLKAVVNNIARVIEHKHAEEELYQTNTLLDSIIENVPNMIFLKEATDLRFVIFNRAGEELLGYDRKALLGKNNLDLFPAEQADNFIAKDREALAKDGVVDISEEPIMTARKGIRLLHTQKVCIRGADGKTKFLLGISEDITERKKLETERATLEEQLRQQQRLESVGQLAAGVAHDFNNLLTGIRGFTQFAYDSMPEGSATREDLAEVLSLAKRATNLTRQLLAFSRRQTIQPVVIDINELIGNFIKMLGRLIGEQIDLKFIPSTQNGSVKADPGQIEQVLVNLAVNARDAMPDGGKLTIETKNVELDEEYTRLHAGTQPGPYVMIAVTDTGCGMDESVLTHIFEPFYSTKEVGQGTGLGLATVYGIIKQHGGNIWVYSELDKGTTFKIYLPQVDDEIIVQAAKKQVELLYGTETILVVEDDATVRGVAERILEILGYHILTAELPSEAISIMEEHGDKIALMLTDVIMPECSGPQLYESIRKKYPDLRVLYMSGYPEKASDRHGILDANTSFIQKPFNSNTLGRKVREVLNEK